MPFLLWSYPLTERPQDNPAFGYHPLFTVAVGLNWSVGGEQNVKTAIGSMPILLTTSRSRRLKLLHRLDDRTPLAAGTATHHRLHRLDSRGFRRRLSSSASSIAFQCETCPQPEQVIFASYPRLARSVIVSSLIRPMSRTGTEREHSSTCRSPSCASFRLRIDVVPGSASLLENAV